jgi:magnesium-transporting ATPase (P-type)
MDSATNLEPKQNIPRRGLTREEAQTRLRQFGPNTVRQAKPQIFFAIARKFWAPVPWMLEATIVLELVLGKRPEAIIIGFLLVFNAGLGFVQEKRAQNALALLQKKTASTGTGATRRYVATAGRRRTGSRRFHSRPHGRRHAG